MFSFIYKAPFDNGLTEHELDHVFVGTSDELPILNREEAEDFEYVDQNLLLKRLEENPSDYTEWFKILIPKVIQKL